MAAKDEQDGRRVSGLLPILAEQYPNAWCSLNYANPLQLLVATVRIERRDLHLMNAFPLPDMAQNLLTKLVDDAAIIRWQARLTPLAQPAMVATQSDKERAGLHVMAPQPLAHFFAHVQQKSQ